MRRAAKRDANEPAIVEALEAAGACVVRLSQEGAPDLLVGLGDRILLLEVKLPLGSKGGTNGSKLTGPQLAWWSKWRGPAPRVVRTPAEALAAIGSTEVP